MQNPSKTAFFFNGCVLLFFSHDLCALREMLLVALSCIDQVVDNKALKRSPSSNSSCNSEAEIYFSIYIHEKHSFAESA